VLFLPGRNRIRPENNLKAVAAAIVELPVAGVRSQ
jgi:hypothetical protein